MSGNSLTLTARLLLMPVLRSVDEKPPPLAAWANREQK